MTFNPRQEQEDSFILVLVTFIFIGFFSGYLVVTHYDTGLVYLLLSQWGQTVEGIVSLVEVPSGPFEGGLDAGSRALALKNSHYIQNVSSAVIDYSTLEGSRQSIEVLFHGNILEPKTSFSITYLPWRPAIAHPTDWLYLFQFDAKLLKWATLVLGAAVCGFLVTLHRYRLFKRNMRRY